MGCRDDAVERVCCPSLSTELVNLSQAGGLPVISASGDKDKGSLGLVG